MYVVVDKGVLRASGQDKFLSIVKDEKGFSLEYNKKELLLSVDEEESDEEEGRKERLQGRRQRPLLYLFLTSISRAIALTLKGSVLLLR